MHMAKSEVSLNNCRCCGSSHLINVMSFDDMPSIAQNFPESHELCEDPSIHLDLNECENCGLIQINSDPVYYYREVIRAAGISNEMRDFRKQQFCDLVHKYNLAGSDFLEIGSGFGEYLTVIKECEVNAFGIEYSDKAVAHCISIGLNVTKNFPEPQHADIHKSFSGFCCLNFIEHWPAPVESLRIVNSWLKENAIGLVEVPNSDLIHKEGMFAEYMLDHLSYFDENSLSTILTLAGFEVLEINKVWHDYILSAVVRKRSAKDFSKAKAQRKLVSNSLHRFIDTFSSKNVAVWGAGHQALAVIAISGVKEKIKYVVDSAEFKQDKFTPGTHVPIYAPSMLKNDPVDAVIIMAASYSDEVYSWIKKDFPFITNIAILRPNGLEIYESA